MTQIPTHALSVKQPWADLILFHGKDVENRTWALPKRMCGSRVFVHASKKPDSCPWSEHKTGWERDKARLGAILGEVTLVKTVTASLSIWFDGPYGFILADPVAYRHPVPCRGALGFWTPSPDVIDQIRGIRE